MHPASQSHLMEGGKNHFRWITYASAISFPGIRKNSTEEENAEVLLKNGNIRKSNTKGRGFLSPRPTTTDDVRKKPTLNQILIKAGKQGIGGGIPGAIAGVIQVLTLMWLRTIINYQYRYGTTFVGAFQTLFKQGGIPRFYRGLWFALIQAPLSRFASTAANDGVEMLLSSFDNTKGWGLGRGTIVASIVVGIWRMVLMPIDTCKTVLQVDSAEGFRNLMRKVRAGKIDLLYQGAFAQAISAIMAHYPWFYTYNFLSKKDAVINLIKSPLLRNATIGFFASFVSDTISNVIRVVKTTKQAIGAKHKVGYGEAISMILAADGWKGLFGRGLKTRIVANGFQSIVFTVIWRGLAQRFREHGGATDINTKASRDSISKESTTSTFDATQSDDEELFDDIDSYD